MYAAAQAIYGDQRNRSVPEGKKQQAALDFYNNKDGAWGEAVTNALYMLNTGNVDDTINKMIFFGKDNQIDENGREIPGTGNQTFQRYYDLLHGYIRAD